MELEWLPTAGTEAPRVWREVVQPVAAELRGSAYDLSDSIVTFVRGEIPQLFPDVQVVEDARASTEESLRLLAQLMEVGADPRQVDLPPSSLAMVRYAVRSHVPLAEHMRFYRLAQEQVWQWLFGRVAAASRDPGDVATALSLTTGWLFTFVDRAMVRADQAYEQERESWLQDTAASRMAAIDDIVAEREQDSQAASKRLRFDLRRHHIGVIAWADQLPDRGDVTTVLTETIGELARFAGAESSLAQPSGSRALAGWLTSRRAYAPDLLERMDDATCAQGLPQEVRVAVGEPGFDLKGFRQTHVEAGHARRVASLAIPGSVRLTRYRDIAVAAMCTADPDHAAAFVKRVLGRLAADDETSFRLAMTLDAYLSENRSRTRAAARLVVHPNTVSYRVRQAEDLLGRSLDGDLLELRVALTLLPGLRRLEH